VHGTPAGTIIRNRELMKDTVKTAPRTVFPQDLPDILSHFPRVKILSLDCFDTLLWRNCAAPTDVFYDLQHAPAFQSRGFNATLRAKAESTARSLMRTRAGLHEVRLPNIYRAAFPDLSDTEVAELADAEVAAEARACYGFPATVELIRAAHRRGLKIAIVSDTYFSQNELRRLLSAALPGDVNAAIEAVFCSSEFGKSKAAGLFRTVLDRLHARSEDVLHVGDHDIADLAAATRHGIHAVRLAHHTDSARQAVRLEAAATALLFPATRHARSLPTVYRGAIAQRQVADASEFLGRIGVGPLLHAFARFIGHRAEILSATGTAPKILFLMRDGHLPMQAFKAFIGDDDPLVPNVHAVEISRFASYASSFRTEADIDRYLARMAGPAVHALAKQLLLPDGTAQKLVARARAAKEPFEEFSRLVHRPEMIATILERSVAFRSRLRRYLERTVGLGEGDTLLFVDLGYSGTAQTCLEPIFREEWGVEVQGCYLLLSRTPGWEANRVGLIAPDLLDDQAIASLVSYVAALEQICTADHGSVIDYTDDGTPVRKPTDVPPEQYERIKSVQAACRQFAADAEAFFRATGAVPSLEDIRLNAVGLLGRLLFFPTREEIATLRGFALDVNLNTDTTIALFHTEQARQSLRRLGLAYTLVDDRMNHPMELRAYGLDLVTLVLAQHRFGWDIALDDLSHERISLPIMLAKGGAVSPAAVEARPTQDGYFAAEIPVGSGEFQFAVNFGQLYSWLQLDSVTLLPVNDLYRKRNVFDEPRAEELDLTGNLIFENIDSFAGGLLHCRDKSAFVFVPTRLTNARSGRFACRIVFRPLSDRPSV
jgi:FMN phosphatase YigB (HAD superfamily)